MGSASSIMKEIESEAERIIGEAEERASKIVEEAKKKASEILDDTSYIDDLNKFARELEENVNREYHNIIEEAKKKAEEIARAYKKNIDEIVKNIVSNVIGVEID
ncbi:MAG: hypothetical protein QXF10_03105 [Ignisphaera sp.]